MPWYVCHSGGDDRRRHLWGAIPGLFKAYFNVNEVITAIMFNWIGLFAVNLAAQQHADDAGQRLGAHR